jgi:hypothetical protein
MSDLERVLSKLDRTSTTCWLWRAGKDKDGYGKTAVGWDGAKMKHVRVHRWIYEQYVGPIPDGMVIDHLCRVKACANPDHLEAVTVGENTARGIAWEHNRRKTHCKHGHSLSDALIKSDGRRECRECARLRAFRYRKSEPRESTARVRPFVGRRKAMSNAKATAITSQEVA